MPRTRLRLTTLLLARAAATAALAVGSLGVGTAPASAGEYVVDGCHHADGSAAPMDGWHAFDGVPAAAPLDIGTACAAGGAAPFGIDMMSTRVENFVGVPVGIQFSTGDPALVPREATLWFALGGQVLTTLNTVSIRPNDRPGINPWDVPTESLGTSSSSITLSSGCPMAFDIYDCMLAGFTHADVQRTSITVADTRSPSVTLAAGTLLDAQGAIRVPVAGGTASLTVAVSDAGSGIRRVVVDVDQATVATAPVAGDSTDCTQAKSGPPVFASLHPCPPSAMTTLTWTPGQAISDDRQVVAYAEDASGNRTVIAQNRAAAIASATPTPVPKPTVPATSQPSPGPAAPGAGTDDPRSAAHLDVGWPSTAKAPSIKPAIRRRCKADAKYAQRNPLRCAGRAAGTTLSSPWSSEAVDRLAGRVLDTSGKTMAGTKVLATASWNAAGIAAPTISSATSAADGTFTINIPRTLGSLDITLRAGNATAQLTRRVAARTTLTAPPHVAAGSQITFSGNLLGRTGNLARVPINLDVWSGGRWHTFASAQTTTKGTWKSRIRFARTPGTYHVRARVGASIGYPFAAGASDRTRSILVR